MIKEDPLTLRAGEGGLLASAVEEALHLIDYSLTLFAGLGGVLRAADGLVNHSLGGGRQLLLDEVDRHVDDGPDLPLAHSGPLRNLLDQLVHVSTSIPAPAEPGRVEPAYGGSATNSQFEFKVRHPRLIFHEPSGPGATSSQYPIDACRYTLSGR